MEEEALKEEEEEEEEEAIFHARCCQIGGKGQQKKNPKCSYKENKNWKHSFVTVMFTEILL